MKALLYTTLILYSLLIGVFANCYHYITDNLYLLFIFVPAFIYIVTLSGFIYVKTKRIRLKFAYHGAYMLSICWLSSIVTILYQTVYAFYTLPINYVDFLWSLGISIFVEATVFWVGVISVYFSSLQMGIKHRFWGAVCALIPGINLFILAIIIKTVFKEVYFEIDKDKLNESRKHLEVCKTKYPILMVHGLFLRDLKYFNYWGRIPKELTKNGATIFFGNHQSALSVPDSAQELAARIREIIKETGAEKLNIIAHSKGGIDCRYAIKHLGVEDMIASLTTVSTPHRGCEFADYLLTKLPQWSQKHICKTYNTTLKKLGDTNPDFYAAVKDLTAEACIKFDKETEVPKGIYCQSYGSVITKMQSGKFPFNFSSLLVKHFSGPNDGLVSQDSFEWGERYTLLYPTHKEGISHGDMMDLNRRDIQGFDVREFYVQLVNELKEKGL